MTGDIRVDAVDPAGAIAETRAAADASSRRRFLLAVTAGAAGLTALASAPAARAASKNDVAILNYALTLEELQAAFYSEAERGKALSGQTAVAARTLGAVERAHVGALRKVLGRSAVAKPFFDFQGTTENQDVFLKTAVAFEDLAVAAYKGQAPLIDAPEVLAAAISIHSVEARHAAWIRFLVGAPPVIAALDEPQSRDEVLALVRATGFIARRPRTASRRRPKFTG